jgi:hypothetical protein
VKETVQCGYTFKYTPKLLLPNGELAPFKDDQHHAEAPELTYDSTTKQFTVAKCVTNAQKDFDRACSQSNTRKETVAYTIVVQITPGDDDNARFEPVTDYRFAIAIGDACSDDKLRDISIDGPLTYTFPIGYDSESPIEQVEELRVTRSAPSCPMQCTLHTENDGITSAAVRSTKFVKSFDTLTGAMTLQKTDRDDGETEEKL